MIFDLPMKNMHLEVAMDEYEKYLALQDRRLYLTSEIKNSEDESDGECMSKVSQIVDDIIAYNRKDSESKVEERKPIRLYINSPGGSVQEGYALVSTIELSKTPIYTINTGIWDSMAFLIGITGHKRFSLPNMRFMMHDGWEGDFNSLNKVQDKIEFSKRFEKEVVRKHVLAHSHMSSKEYDKLLRVDYYMLPEDALKHGFIDEIVTDIDTIL